MPDPDHPGIFDLDPFDLANRMLDETWAELARPNDFGPYTFVPDRPPLGTGALGDVWLAEERKAGRLVAVKFLWRVSHPEVAANEIKNQGRLEHKYVARLYNHGVLDDGTAWLAMEYVDGQPLDKYRQLRNPTVRQRLKLFHAICEAVKYAHSEKIDHGDLKPSNILVKESGDPKLVDFNLARRLHDEGALAASPVLGFTPAYAAPEQIRGTSSGFRSDVYALGVILYELLAGQVPFDAPKRTLAEIESFKFSAEQPAPPSMQAKQFVAYYRQISRGDWLDLDAICLKAMAAAPEDRYPSVEALLQELDRFERRESIQARVPHPPAYRLRKFVSRNRSGVIAASLTILLSAAGLTIYTIQVTRARNAAVAEAARTQQVKQFFLTAFNHAAEEALPAEKSRIISLILDHAARDAASLRQDRAMQADVYQGLGEMYREWGVLGRAEQLARQAVAINESSVPTILSRVVSSKLALGDVLEERGAYDDAIVIGNGALRLRLDDKDRAKALRLLANAHFHLGNYPLAEKLNLEALALDRKIYGPRHPEIADDLMNLGNFQIQQGNYALGERYYRRALEINESSFGEDSPQVADSASYIAQALYFQGGREREALSLLRRSLAVLERTHADADSRVAFTIAQMGAVEIELKNLGQAEHDFARAADIYRSIRGDEHQSVAIELSNVASIALAKKEFVRAEQLFRDVIRRLEKVLPADNANIGIARIKLGHSILGQRRYQESALELLAGYRIVAKQTSPSVSWLTTARKDLVAAYDAIGKPDEAAKFQTNPAAQE